ncbi:MAG: hypothetical protein AB8F74_07360, partial [Saprospiraceae bacterium]
MKNTLLWELIGSFSIVEKRRAVKFLASPYCNPKQEVAELFGLLLTYQRKNKLPKKEEIYQSLFPDRPFDAQAFRLLQSHLYKCLERFITWEYCEAQNNLTVPLRLQSFRERNLQRHLGRQLKQAIQRPYEQAENYLSEYQKER